MPQGSVWQSWFHRIGRSGDAWELEGVVVRQGRPTGRDTLWHLRRWIDSCIALRNRWLQRCIGQSHRTTWLSCAFCQWQASSSSVPRFLQPRAGHLIFEAVATGFLLVLVVDASSSVEDIATGTALVNCMIPSLWGAESTDSSMGRVTEVSTRSGGSDTADWGSALVEESFMDAERTGTSSVTGTKSSLGTGLSRLDSGAGLVG